MVMTAAAPPPRTEIKHEHTWNKESVFATTADWDAEAEAIPAAIPEVTKFKGRLAEGPGVLADYMDASSKLMRRVSKLFFYAQMSAAVDSNDKAAQSMVGRAQGVFGRVQGANAFGQPELIAIGRDTLVGWMEREPRLAQYAHYVDNLFRQQEHVRSAEVEEVMGLVNDPFATSRSTYDLLTSAELPFRPATDSQGNEVPVMQGNLDGILDGPDRDLRRTAWESYRDGYLAFKGTIATNLTASIKASIFQARVRHYDSSIAASLFQNNIPVAVFDNLIETYRKNIPTWHRYWRARRKALGVDKLHEYDIWAPLTSNEPHVPYEKSVDYISKGMAPLGDAYVNALRKGCLEDRWVDIYPNQGKRDGAFSYGTYDTYPFIMMSYTDTLGGMSTLAHELGHSLHSYHSRKHQPFQYAGYSLFVAEVASNFNQAMTRAYLMDAHADDRDFQLALISETMSNFHRYFFIMPTLARFEREIHARIEAGKGVTADDMNALMTDLFSEGYGDEMVVHPDRTGITWATFGHLYASFYVYQYATGISAAHELAAKILREEDGAVKRYIEFLSAGSSMYPIDALQHAGVDMTQPDAVETTFNVLSQVVDRLESLI